MSVISIAVRVAFTLLKTNPLNIVVLETMGFLELFCSSYSNIILQGPSFLSNCSNTHSSTTTASSTNVGLSGSTTNKATSTTISPDKGRMEIDSKPPSVLNNTQTNSTKNPLSTANNILPSATNTNTNTDDNHTLILNHHSNMKIHHDEIILLLSQMSLFIQSAAVTTSCRDASVITYLVHLMLSVTVMSSNYHSVRDLSNRNITQTPASHPMRGFYSNSVNRPSKLPHTRNTSFTIFNRCQNCEAEEAVYECLHEMCTKDTRLMCRECDRVFHKSTLKRTHFRLRIVDCMVLDALQTLKSQIDVNTMIMSVIRQHEEIMNAKLATPSNGLSTIPSPLGKTDGDNNCNINTNISSDNVNSNMKSLFQVSTFIDSVLCLLTSTLRGLIDDRYIRCQSVSSTLIDPLMICLRLITTAAPSYCSNDNDNTGISAQTAMSSPIKVDVSMNTSLHSTSTPTTNTSTSIATSPILRTNSQDTTTIENDTTVTSQFPMRFDIDLARLCDTRHDIELTSQSAEFLIGKFDSPPDMKKKSPRRCCLSLFLQLIARCIIHEDGVSNDTPRMSMKKQLVHAASSTIQSFRKLGGEALFIHLLLSDSKSLHVQLTMSDKHFILWILRECIVSGLKNNDETAATEILRWLLWPLNAPIADETNSNEIKDIVPISYGPRFLSSVSLAYTKKKIPTDFKNRPVDKSTNITIDYEETDLSTGRPPIPSSNANINSNANLPATTQALHKYSLFPLP